MNITRPAPPVSVALALTLLCPAPAGAWPLSLALPPATAVPEDRPAEAPASATTGSGKPKACPEAREAARRYTAGKYAEAAALYEDCARNTGEASFWKKAGMARYSARQFAHAIQALGGYPRAAAGEQEDEPMVAMLRDAQAQSVLVRFGVTADADAPRPEQLRLVPRGEDAGRDTITIAWSRSTVALDVWLDPGAWQAELVLPGDGRVGPQDVAVVQDAAKSQQVLFRVASAPPPEPPPEPPAAPPIEVTVTVMPTAAVDRGVDVAWDGPAEVVPQHSRSATTRWQLAPGTWTLRVAAPRFTPATRTLAVTSPTTVMMALTRTRADRARIGVSAAAGGVALGLVIGGLVGALGGRRDYKAAVASLDVTTDRPATLSAALTGIKHASTGTIALGSGLGVAIAAATVAADGSERLLGAEVGVGAALFISGLAWLIPAKRRYYKDALADGAVADEVFFEDHRVPELVAASLLGLGTGLIGGASVALITRAAIGGGKRRRNASVAPLAALRTVGLNFQASF